MDEAKQHNSKKDGLQQMKKLSLPEMQQLISDLLACESPKYAPNGKNVIHYLSFYL